MTLKQMPQTLSTWWWFVLGIVASLNISPIISFAYQTGNNSPLIKTILYLLIAAFIVGTELALVLLFRPSLKTKQGIVKLLVFFLILNPILLVLAFGVLFWNSSFPFTDV